MSFDLIKSCQYDYTKNGLVKDIILRKSLRENIRKSLRENIFLRLNNVEEQLGGDELRPPALPHTLKDVVNFLASLYVEENLSDNGKFKKMLNFL